jgi:hypothetical protein
MNQLKTAQFRATAAEEQGFGKTPHEALKALMRQLPGEPSGPIVIWPYNRGDAYFSDAQHARMQELKSRKSALTAEEGEELEHLIEAAFDATIARTQAIPVVKS